MSTCHILTSTLTLNYLQLYVHAGIHTRTREHDREHDRTLTTELYYTAITIHLLQWL